MPKVVIPVREEILQAAERRQDAGIQEDIAAYLAELIDLGFEHRLQQLYRQYEAGEISFEYFAEEMGLGVRELYDVLERREMPSASMELQPSG
jgi:hypothetical protein